jgi:hypothetical protein
MGGVLSTIVKGMSSIPPLPYLEFVYTRLFQATRRGVLADEEVRVVEDALLENPEAGAMIAGTGGVRKIRAAQEGRGKRGSARVVYLYVARQRTVYFILTFPKNVQVNLTEAQKKAVREMVAEIEAEEWPRKGFGP